MSKTPPTWTETKNLNGQKVEATFQWVDNGIGAFECHGFKGHQSDWTAELISTKNEANEEVDVNDETIRDWETVATENYKASRD